MISFKNNRIRTTNTARKIFRKVVRNFLFKFNTIYNT